MKAGLKLTLSLCLFLAISGCSVSSDNVKDDLKSCRPFYESQIANFDSPGLSIAESVSWVKEISRWGGEGGFAAMLIDTIETESKGDGVNIFIGSGLTNTGKGYKLLVVGESVYIKTLSQIDAEQMDLQPMTSKTVKSEDCYPSR